MSVIENNKNQGFYSKAMDRLYYHRAWSAGWSVEFRHEAGVRTWRLCRFGHPVRVLGSTATRAETALDHLMAFGPAGLEIQPQQAAG